jgi:hypothetical protein
LSRSRAPQVKTVGVVIVIIIVNRSLSLSLAGDSFMGWLIPSLCRLHQDEKAQRSLSLSLSLSL